MGVEFLQVSTVHRILILEVLVHYLVKIQFRLLLLLVTRLFVRNEGLGVIWYKNISGWIVNIYRCQLDRAINFVVIAWERITVMLLHSRPRHNKLFISQ